MIIFMSTLAVIVNIASFIFIIWLIKEIWYNLIHIKFEFIPLLIMVFVPIILFFLNANLWFLIVKFKIVA
jgi:hypothetical protein